MTRFARAKGSKASNERLPESATSWSEMKQDLLSKNKDLAEKQKREEALKQRQANYQAFLQEREEEEEKKITWADFPGANDAGNKIKPSSKRKASTSDDGNSFKKNKQTNLIQLNGEDDDDSDDSDGQFSNLKSQIDKILDQQKEGGSDSDEAPPEEVSIKEKPQEIVIKKPKKPIKQKLKIVLDKEKQLSSDVSKETSLKKVKQQTDDRGEEVNKLIDKKYERQRKQAEKKKLKKQKLQNGETPNSVAPKQNNVDPEKQQKKLERRKKQKEKKKTQLLESTKVELEKPENLSEEELKKIQKKKERRARQAEKRKVIREAKALEAENSKNQNSDEKTENHDENKNNLNAKRKFTEPDQSYEFTEKKPLKKPQNNQKQKPGKQRDNKEHPSRKQKPGKQRDNKEHPSRKQKPEVMFINGKTVEVDYVDGFPVKKEDADRLKKLRKEMISKGLPRSEINASLKLERRRAEKAFAREKKNVCFNCRKSGHNLSECPELDKNQVVQSAGTGICFKCGSTEHTHFECKVVKGLDYKFATCFICKEQGHIAKQCPDNQRGLYPKGGSCKVCGDVTHLKKDCPKYQAQQSQLQSSLSIGTIDNGNPDDLGSRGPNNSFASGAARRLNKVVKF